MTETTTKPYLIRAIHEWCVDNGFTPYMAVSVNESTRVPRAYVKAGEIVLNTSPLATSRLSLGNEWIEFQARFGGVAQDIAVPVEQVIAVYARENGQGMAFEVPKNLAEVSEFDDDDQDLEQLIDEVLGDLDDSRPDDSVEPKQAARLKSTSKKSSEQARRVTGSTQSGQSEPGGAGRETVDEAKGTSSKGASSGRKVVESATEKSPLGLVSIVPSREGGEGEPTDPDDAPSGPKSGDSEGSKKDPKNRTKPRKNHLTRIK